MSDIHPKDNSGKFVTRHGMYGTKLYHIWNGMRQRCNNPNNKDYKDYGGRGITVCEEWETPEVFFEWALLNGYNDELTIDRVDNSKEYSPNNCRWITSKEQQRNKRNNKVIEYNGESHCVAEWAEITGFSESAIHARIKYGWSLEDTFSIPPSHRNHVRRKKNRRVPVKDEYEVYG